MNLNCSVSTNESNEANTKMDLDSTRNPEEQRRTAVGEQRSPEMRIETSQQEEHQGTADLNVTTFQNNASVGKINDHDGQYSASTTDRNPVPSWDPLLAEEQERGNHFRGPDARISLCMIDGTPFKGKIVDDNDSDEEKKPPAVVVVGKGTDCDLDQLSEDTSFNEDRKVHPVKNDDNGGRQLVPPEACSLFAAATSTLSGTSTSKQPKQDPLFSPTGTVSSSNADLPSKHRLNSGGVARLPPTNNMGMVLSDSEKKSQRHQKNRRRSSGKEKLYANAHASQPGAYAVRAGQLEQLYWSARHTKTKLFGRTDDHLEPSGGHMGTFAVSQYCSEAPVEADSTIVSPRMREEDDANDGTKRYQTRILFGIVTGVLVIVAAATGITFAVSPSDGPGSTISSSPPSTGITSVTLFGRVYETATATVVILSNQHGEGGLPNGSTIPTEIGLLTGLTRLDLSFNNDNLKGTIPSELGMLTGLLQLSLENNSLDGLICPELGMLTQLTSLSLGGNDIHGTIPSEIGLMQSLEELQLESNRLSGTIPTVAFSGLKALTSLSLFENGLSGSLPSSLCSNVNPRIDCNEISCTCCMKRTSVGRCQAAY